MVTKAEKESAEKIAGYAQRSKELYISRLSSLPESIKENTIKKDYPLVVSNIREACKYALLLGMVHVRFDKDLAAALQAFDQGLAFAQKLEPLLEAAEQVVPSVKIDLSNFFNPLFCCLLSARWPICEQFARWSTSPVCLVKEPHDNGYFVRLLAALIQGRDDEISGILAARAKHVGKSAPAHASYFALIEGDSGEGYGIVRKGTQTDRNRIPRPCEKSRRFFGRLWLRQDGWCAGFRFYEHWDL